MNFRILTTLLTLIIPSTLFASINISGFFGVNLGEPFNGKYEKLVRGGVTEPMIEYKVKVPSTSSVKSFSYFKVLLQTKTKKVSAINADLETPSWEQCKKQKEIIYKVMVNKYGSPPLKPENQYYTFRTKDNARMAEIECSSPTPGGNPILELTVIDHNLIKEIEREYAARNHR